MFVEHVVEAIRGFLLCVEAPTSVQFHTVGTKRGACTKHLLGWSLFILCGAGACSFGSKLRMGYAFQLLRYARLPFSFLASLRISSFWFNLPQLFLLTGSAQVFSI